MNGIFDKYGNLDIEELIINQPSFLKIMEDGIVTDEELREQSDKVESLLEMIEKNMNAEQLEQIKELLAELSVLIAIREIHDRSNG